LSSLILLHLRLVFFFLFFCIIQLPHISTLFPYTTLFRSVKFFEQWLLCNERRYLTCTPLSLAKNTNLLMLNHLCIRTNVITNVGDRKSTRLNSSHVKISYAVFCLKKKIHHEMRIQMIYTT